MPKSPHPGRAGHKLAIPAGITADQAFAALAKVKLSDVKKLEAKESAQKNRCKRQAAQVTSAQHGFSPD
jgi:hypothetical protein